MAENLMTALLNEMNRVRKVITQYEDPALNGAGNIAAFLMKRDIENAEQAIGTGDVVQMLLCFSKLQEVEGD